MYKGTHGSEWTQNTNWLTEQPLRLWFGITATEDDRVLCIDLSRNQLRGTLPPSLYTLDKLAYARFSHNELIWPPTLPSLPAVVGLYLDHCRLRHIPATVFVDTMVTCSLAFNELQRLPPIIAPQLVVLSLQGNAGMDVTHSTIVAPELLDLNIGSLGISKWPDSWNSIVLHDLRSLVVSHNNFSVLPQKWSRCFPGLTDLDISHNQLTILPAGFDKLDTLNASHNRLIAIAIEEEKKEEDDNDDKKDGDDDKVVSIDDFGSMATTTTTMASILFDVSWNAITEIPEQQRFVSRNLILHHNDLTSFSLASIASSVSVLDLSHNSITDVVSPKMSCSVAALDLSHNKLATLPDWLSIDFTVLTTLDLSHNQLLDIDVTWVVVAPLLASLNLSNNPISQVSVQSTGYNLPRLQNLDLRGTPWFPPLEQDSWFADTFEMGTMYDMVSLGQGRILCARYVGKSGSVLGTTSLIIAPDRVGYRLCV